MLHAVQWNVLDDLGVGRGMVYTFHSYSYSFKVTNCCEMFLSLPWSVWLSPVLQSWHRHCAQINICLWLSVFVPMLLRHISLAADITQQSWRKGLRVSLAMLYQQASASPPSTHLRSPPFLLRNQRDDGITEVILIFIPSHNFPLPPREKAFAYTYRPIGYFRT